MGTRPLRDDERAIIEAKIKEAKERLGLLNRTIAEWEKELEDGIWYYDPEAFNQMCEEVKEVARKDVEACSL